MVLIALSGACALVNGCAYLKDLQRSGRATLDFYGYRCTDYLALALLRALLPSCAEGFAILLIISAPCGEWLTWLLATAMISLFSPCAFLLLDGLARNARVRVPATHVTMIPASRRRALAVRLLISCWKSQPRTIAVVQWMISALVSALAIASTYPTMISYIALCMVAPALTQRLIDAQWQPANSRAQAFYGITDHMLLRAHYRAFALLLFPYASITMIGSLISAWCSYGTFVQCGANALILIYHACAGCALIYVMYCLATAQGASVNDCETTLLFFVHLVPGLSLLVAAILIVIARATKPLPEMLHTRRRRRA